VEVGGDYFVAFSRDQPEKVYVQHKILEQVPFSAIFFYLGFTCFLSYFDWLKVFELLGRYVVECVDL